MKSFTILIQLSLIASLLAGCSNIGKINGQNISRVTGENPNPTYCQSNPEICIIGIAAALGGTAIALNEIAKNNKSTSASTPTVTPPPILPGGGGFVQL